VLVAVAVASSTAACGDSGDDPELSRSTASSLRADLNQISRSVRDGDCTTAQQVTAQLQSEVDGLRGDVSARLRRALSASTERLDTLVRDQCEPAAAPAPAVTPETQDTTQDDKGKKEKQDKADKPKKPEKPAKEKSEEVPPGQDGGDGTTTPGQQDGEESPGGDTGGASPEGG
jgi:hypothetical protein